MPRHWLKRPAEDVADHDANGRALICPCPFVRASDGKRCSYQSIPGDRTVANHPIHRP